MNAVVKMAFDLAAADSNDLASSSQRSI